MFLRHLVISLAFVGALSACRSHEKKSPPAPATPPTTVAAEGAAEAEASAAAAKGEGEAPERREIAILAGGCFWGMEEILREVPGVIDTEVGYAGGRTASPSYDEVKTGETGHAEAVRVTFDPSELPYAELLEKWFFRMHDPTTENRQGNDVGSQYRSAIFATSEAQLESAEAVKERLEAKGVWERPLVTEVTMTSGFTPAEAYHQDYLQKNPGGYTCHYLRDFGETL